MTQPLIEIKELCYTHNKQDILHDINLEVHRGDFISIIGPKKAFLIQGEDRVGALYDFHLKLSNAGINIYASNGVVDGTGRFGYVIWVNPDDYKAAAKALKSSDWRTIQLSPPGQE